MKKFTLLTFVALLIAATGMAQKQHPLSVERMKALSPTTKVATQKAPSAKSRQSQVDLQRQISAREILGKKNNNTQKTTGPRNIKKNVASFIDYQPEGEQVLYQRSGSAYYVVFGYLFDTALSGAIGNVVFGEGNKVFIKDIISQYASGTWVEGTIDGSKITVSFPQQVLDYYGEAYYAQILRYDAGEQWYLPVSASDNKLVFNYDAATGDIAVPENSALATGEEIVAMTDAAGEWTGYADWDIGFTKMTDTPVEAPEGIETSVYSLTADDYDGSLVNVGFVGNDVYIQGIYSGLPDAWIKGTLTDDKVVFHTGQYLGADETTGYFQYFVSATSEQYWDDIYEEYNTEYALSDNEVVFDFDPSTKKLFNGSLFLINGGNSEVNYAAVLDNAVISPFVETPATPANPVWSTIFDGGYSYYSYGYGWGYLEFKTPVADTEGNFIVADKLSYQIYTKVNGEVKPLVLSADDYVNQTVPEMSEIPYSYDDAYDIGFSEGNHYVYYYVIGPEAYGVQSIYRGGGEEHRSEIVWYDVEGLGSEVQPDAATPAYPDVDPANVGGSIAYGLFTGEEDVNVFGESKPETYDVAIHVQDKALVGTYIESITIPIMDNVGVSNVSAWISSQLRVENNVNVPDLAQVNVDVTEPGFVTVKLDKPYVIPEDGVYVGYSLTIDDVTSQENANPVALMEGYNPGGFYIHTSQGFLKWLDVSELMGASSIIMVQVGGRNIQENAAAPQEGEMQYVMVGQPSEVNVVFANHGSKGIESLDVECTVNGQTVAQHLQPEEALPGIFGKSFAATLNVPAISERGNYQLDIKVTKVNGVDNQDVNPTASVELVALKTTPKHRTLLEEYTGTWCGWCPRGLVALENLAKLYPDEFVVISYHNGDPMEIMAEDYFPSVVGGYPSSFMDRIVELDPYYGSGQKEFGVVDDLTKRSKVFGRATIDLSSAWSTSGKSINITADVTFPYDVTDGNYALEYVLVQNGMTGEGSDWLQSNYYSGGEQGDMGNFDEAESSVPGVVFDDVAVLMSQIGGIDGSIPTNVAADEPVQHKYSFYLSDAVNTSRQNIIQDKDKLFVVALLIDKNTGEVVNAIKVKVGDSTGINGVESTKNQVTSVAYYDLTGRQLSTPRHGVNIVVMKYSDGTQSTMKIFK
jgi:thiol-disulfide isomerase/thioredoxin